MYIICLKYRDLPWQELWVFEIGVTMSQPDFTTGDPQTEIERVVIHVLTSSLCGRGAFFVCTGHVRRLE